MDINGKFFKRLWHGIVITGLTASLIACGDNPQAVQTPPSVTFYLEPGNSLPYRNILFSNRSSRKLIFIRDSIEHAYAECKVGSRYKLLITAEDVDYTGQRQYFSNIQIRGNSVTIPIGTLGLARSIDRYYSARRMSPTHEEFLRLYEEGLSGAFYGAVCTGGYVGKPDFKSRGEAYYQELESKISKFAGTVKPVYVDGISCLVACSPDLPANFRAQSVR